MVGEPVLLDSSVEKGTRLAAERTKLAKERTFAAWIRTALAAAGIGIALAKFVPSTENKLLVQIVGLTFVTSGILIFVLGLISYRDVVKRLEADVTAAIPVWLAVILTAVLMLGSTIGLVAIILEW